MDADAAVPVTDTSSGQVGFAIGTETPLSPCPAAAAKASASTAVVVAGTSLLLQGDDRHLLTIGSTAFKAASLRAS